MLHRLSGALLGFAVSANASVAESARNCLAHLTWTRYAAADAGMLAECGVGAPSGATGASSTQGLAAAMMAASSGKSGTPGRSPYLVESLFAIVIADLETTSRDVIAGLSSSPAGAASASWSSSSSSCVSSGFFAKASSFRCARLLDILMKLLRSGGIHERDRAERSGSGGGTSGSGSSHGGLNTKFSQEGYADAAIMLLPLGGLLRLLGSSSGVGGGAAAKTGSSLLPSILQSPRLQKLAVGGAMWEAFASCSESASSDPCGGSSSSSSRFDRVDPVQASLELATTVVECCGSLLCVAGDWIGTLEFALWELRLDTGELGSYMYVGVHFSGLSSQRFS